MRAAFGRVETIPIGSGSVSILLIKNPAGANEVLRTLKLEGERTAGTSAPAARTRVARADGIDLWIALNDRIADGRDVSWVWDADFEVLSAPCGASPAPAPARRRWRCG